MVRITIKPNDKLLTNYYKDIKRLRGGQDIHHEGAVRRAFGTLLEGIGKKKKWTFSNGT